jgi:hypothetical protein
MHLYFLLIWELTIYPKPDTTNFKNTPSIQMQIIGHFDIFSKFVYIIRKKSKKYSPQVQPKFD